MKGKFLRQLLGFSLSAISAFMMVVMASGESMAASTSETSQEQTQSVDYNLSLPTERDTDQDGTMEMTWDCVYYGSYPQSEITNNRILNAIRKVKETDWVKFDIPDKPYSTLSYYTGGTGQKYLRMKKSDALYVSNDTNRFYDWGDDEEYHYFLYEPIKWRVLDIGEDGKNATLIADKGIDTVQFHPTIQLSIVQGHRKEANLWKHSTVRSYLNGYGVNDVLRTNALGYDYSGNYSFKAMAFSKEEQEALINTRIYNNESYFHVYDGSRTYDDIYLLSYAEAVSNGIYEGYGLIKDSYRYTQPTTYARAMGAYTNAGYSYSWLRSSGSYEYRVSSWCYSGHIHRGGHKVVYQDFTVRPVLHLDLTKDNLWTYAGEVDSEGRYSYYKGIFDFDGVKTEVFADVCDYLTVPKGYEETGYLYQYSVDGEDVTEKIKKGTYQITKNVEVKVSRVEGILEESQSGDSSEGFMQILSITPMPVSPETPVK